MHNFLRFFTLLMALCLIGCGATLPKVKPFKIDIQQGNVVTSEMLLKLRPGMTKSQVKFIMGTPLLVDSFRTNRWDYFYQLRKQGKIVSQRRVILDFENDLLKRVRGDVVAKGKTVEDVTKELEQEAKEKGQSAETEQTESVGASEPVIQPMEVPAIESTERVTETNSAEAVVENADGAEQASVLAVPIKTAPAETELKDSAEAAVTDTVKEDVTANAVEESVVPESTLNKEPKIEMQEKVLTVMPSKANEEKLIFRMDRSLDTTRIIPQEVSTSDAPLENSDVQEAVRKSEDLTQPAEEPGFFERMLEKIGF